MTEPNNQTVEDTRALIRAQLDLAVMLSNKAADALAEAYALGAEGGVSEGEVDGMFDDAEEESDRGEAA